MAARIASSPPPRSRMGAVRPCAVRPRTHGSGGPPPAGLEPTPPGTGAATVLYGPRSRPLTSRAPSSVPSRGPDGDWWSWVEGARDRGVLVAAAPPRGRTLQQRMPWIKWEVSSKDSLAAVDDPAQAAAVLAATRRSAAVPVTFFTDLAGKQRCIKESSKTGNNPFMSAGNPLPLGFGLEDDDAADRAGVKPFSRGRTAAATPAGSRDSLALGAVVQQLVARDVEEGVARRAVAQGSACRTVAGAMKWILDHEPAAVGELEARWRQRTVRARSSSERQRSDSARAKTLERIPRTLSAQKRSAAAHRFLARKQGVGGNGGNGAAARTPSDVGSININLHDTSSCAGSSHYRANQSSGATSRPEITVLYPGTPDGLRQMMMPRAGRVGGGEGRYVEGNV